MTEEEAIRIISQAESDFLIHRDAETAREALQPVFSACFSQLETDKCYAEPLDKAYRLLRLIENNSPVPESFGCRCDIGFVCEGLVVCSEILSHQPGKPFVLERDFESAFVCVEIKALCRLLLNIFANAAKYSRGGKIVIKLSLFDGSVGISVTNSGRFDAEAFQKALSGDGSLGFVSRALKPYGGSVVMTSNENVCVAVKIPLCKKELPVILPFAVEDLLYDRLSLVYVAFCAH